MERNCAYLLINAGKSLRMGIPKHRLMVNGKTFLEFQLDQIRHCSEVIAIYIVTSSEFFQELKQLAENYSNVHILLNDKDNSEPFDSYLIGLREIFLDKDIVACFMQPVDVPVDQLLLKKMLDCPLSEESLIQAVYQDRRGHPLLICKKILAKFLLEPQRLDLFLRRFPRQLVEANTNFCTLNLNTPQMWREFLAQVSIKIENEETP